MAFHGIDLITVPLSLAENKAGNRACSPQKEYWGRERGIRKQKEQNKNKHCDSTATIFEKNNRQMSVHLVSIKQQVFISK